MNEDEIRKIVREELHTLLTDYKILRSEQECITDKSGNICYGQCNRYSEKEIVDILIDKLSSNEVENDKT